MSKSFENTEKRNLHLVFRPPSLGGVPNKVNYLAPVQKGKLVARGRSIRIGKTMALGDAYITGD